MQTELLDAVEREVLGWPGVDKEAGRFSSTVYRFGRRELGHVHRDRVFDLPVPRDTRERLLAQGRARPHRAGSKGYVSHPVRDAEDLSAVIGLLQANYERAKKIAEAVAARREKDRADAAKEKTR